MTTVPTEEAEVGTLKVRTTSEGGFERFEKDAEWFRAELASRRVTIIGGSQMDLALKAMTRISESFKSEPQAGAAEGLARVLQDADARAELVRLVVDGVGCTSLVRAIQKAVAIDAQVFDDKWDLFRGPDVVLARYNRRTQERDLVWELYVAALCVLAARDVEIAGTGNPDVRCSVRDIRWGIECKVFDSPNPERHMKRIQEGVRQLQNSDVDRGFVAANVTSVIDHTRFSQSVGRFGQRLFDSSEIMAELKRQIDDIVRPFTEEPFHAWMKKYPKTRAIFFQGHAIALAGKTLSLTTFRRWLDLDKPTQSEMSPPFWPEGPDQAMSNRFEKAAQSFS